MKYKISLILVISITIAQALGASVIRFGNARFSVMSSRLIRMEYSEKKIFTDEPSFIFVNRELENVDYIKRVEDSLLTIETQYCKLFYVNNGEPFNETNLKIEYQEGESVKKWTPVMKDTGNLFGTTRTLDGINGNDTPLEKGLLSKNGWVLLDDSKGLLFDDSPWKWVKKREDPKALDWYFLGYGRDYRGCLKDFIHYAGKIPMPPKYAFGYWWSKYWAYSESEIKKLVGQFELYEIPMDVFIIDMDWHTTDSLYAEGSRRDEFGQRIGWTGYTWEEAYFPDPKRILNWMEEKKLKTALNLHPASGITPREKCYENFARALGYSDSYGKAIPYRMSDKKWAENYFEIVLGPIKKLGVDFWWLDWQQWLESKHVSGLNNTWWLNYTFTTWTRRNSDQRPFLFHRWGGLGNHRYQIGFSGDTYSTWESLAFQPYFTATAANVGYGYWSHDIGGHNRADTDPELYLRWIQYGVFSPILRTHATKSTLNERRFWKYPDYFEETREAIVKRYEMAPYIYQNSRIAYDEGVSICHPLYYDYPYDSSAYMYPGQYAFGNAMMVAPVTEKSCERTRTVKKEIWLPRGEWFDWERCEKLTGGRKIFRAYTVDEIPLFIKMGSIIPIYPPVKNLQDPVNSIIFRIVPGDSGSLDYYEDDGTTDDYQDNGFCRTQISYKKEENRIEINIGAVRGKYRGISDSMNYSFHLPSTYPIRSIVVNGKKTDLERTKWRYEKDKLANYFELGKKSRKDSISIHIEFIKGSRDLSGYAGKMKRFLQIKDIYKEGGNLYTWNYVPPAFKKLHETPFAIEYYPERIDSFLTVFDSLFPEAIDQILRSEHLPILYKERIAAMAGMDSLFPISPEIKWDQNHDTVILTGNKGNKIYYMLGDSKEKKPYEEPLNIIKSSLITTWTENQRGFYSPKVSKFINCSIIDSVYYENSFDSHYGAEGDNSLLNGILGNVDNHHEHWLGFNGKVGPIKIKLKKTARLKKIRLRFLCNQENWIFSPRRVRVHVSGDGETYRLILDKKVEGVDRNQDKHVLKVTSSKVDLPFRYMKIDVETLNEIPQWHKGKNEKPWLFMDEIIFIK